MMASNGSLTCAQRPTESCIDREIQHKPLTHDAICTYSKILCIYMLHMCISAVTTALDIPSGITLNISLVVCDPKFIYWKANPPPCCHKPFAHCRLVHCACRLVLTSYSITWHTSFEPTYHETLLSTSRSCATTHCLSTPQYGVH
jgi:hypothetical protein